MPCIPIDRDIYLKLRQLAHLVKSIEDSGCRILAIRLSPEEHDEFRRLTDSFGVMFFRGYPVICKALHYGSTAPDWR